MQALVLRMCSDRDLVNQTNIDIIGLIIICFISGQNWSNVFEEAGVKSVPKYLNGRSVLMSQVYIYVC